MKRESRTSRLLLAWALASNGEDEKPLSACGVAQAIVQ
jgi:hypothetical protein